MQMFSSSRKTEPAAPMAPTPPPPQPAAKPNPAPNGATELNKGGTLSSGVSIKGTVKFQKELLIDCEVEGRIALSKFCMSRPSIYVVVMPKRGRIISNMRCAQV